MDILMPLEDYIPVDAAPAVFSGTLMLAVLMIAGVATLAVCLIIVARKRKKYAAIPALTHSFVFVLVRGCLSSKSFSQTCMNWMTEAVNILGQGLFKAFLKQTRIDRGKRI